MELEEACSRLQQVFSDVKRDQISNLIAWSKTYIKQLEEETGNEDNASVMLDNIREDIREKLPIEAVTPTEHVLQPTIGKNSDCDPTTTVHVDAFLYDEDAIDDLVEQGQMSRNYCVKCLSKSVKPLTFITHSASVPQIKFIFQFLLQDLRGKMLVDVGSRTGAILYGAFLYSECPVVVGVEIDKTFSELQQSVINKYHMVDRVKVIHSDVMNQGDLLTSSDVVILNNVFEFFMPVDQQIKIWTFLSETVRKKGCLLITIPSIEESLSNLGGNVQQMFQTWLKPVDITGLKEAATMKYFTDPDDSDLEDINLYEVL